MTASTCTSSAPACPFQLAAAGELKAAVTLGQGLPARVNGLPAFYYWKDAIVVGSYIHPAGKFSLDITRDKLDSYAKTFGKMKVNGVAVPILMDHAQSAAATLGWIVDVKRRDDRLMELHQFLGESARDIGLRNKVSLGIDPNFIDGKGNRYGEAIVHSAVTPVPVVPDQGGFEAVENLDNRGNEILTLSLRTLEEPDAHLARCEDTPGSSGTSVFSDSAKQTGVNSGDNPPCVHGGLNGHLAQLAINALSDAVVAKRDLAVARGGVDPSVANELFALLAHDELLLSRSQNNAPIALAVFDALARNRPVPLGEVTQLQVLSRLVPGLDPELANLQQRMIALASGATSAKG
jgi:hypothetical protein